MSDNTVVLSGRVSRKGILKYTPSGIALCEFIMAVPQTMFEKRSIGYLDVMLCGDLAETQAATLRVGQAVEVRGGIFSRAYRARTGARMKEIKIIADRLEVPQPDKKKVGAK